MQTAVFLMLMLFAKRLMHMTETERLSQCHNYHNLLHNTYNLLVAVYLLCVSGVTAVTVQNFGLKLP